MEKIDTTDTLDLIKNIPDLPGVYLMKDKSGKIIYVGKAKILKNRVRQYFIKPLEKDPKTKALVEKIASVETIVTKTETEALILENTLIKLHKPKYNILLKDDKTYPYIRITLKDKFPKIEVTRNIKKDGSRYFGAYTKPSDVRSSVDYIRRIFPIRTCNRKITDNDNQRPCLFYHMKLCSAPCSGNIIQKEYAQIVKEACKFLEGNQDQVIKELNNEMNKYSENMEFEKAARIRDKLKSIQSLTSKQLVLSTKHEDRDICSYIRDGINTLILVLFIRNGRLMGKNVNIIENTYNLDDTEVIESFLTQFYGNGREVPPEILLPINLEYKDALNEWLSQLRGKKSSIVTPVKGEKKELLQLAFKNASEEFNKYRETHLKREENSKKAVDRLNNLLNTDIEKIEAYDISNTGDKNKVGGMVVFVNGRADKDLYRRFKIKNVELQNDYACMQEVLFRRLKRIGEPDESFGDAPDLILIDGGLGHVSAVLEVLEELNLDIPVLGMAKDDKHQSEQLVSKEHKIPLKQDSNLWWFISTIQEEVHRYSIRYHRSLRGNAQKKSLLDDIEGIGPKKKKELLKTFGSVKRIRELSVEDLIKVKGINKELAEKILSKL